MIWLATTVNNAFDEFMKITINLDPNDTKTARTSRDNLIENINTFTEDSDFFCIYKDRNLKFGSFARNTKKRPLDDVDLIICVCADGRTYLESTNCIYIIGNEADSTNSLLVDGTNHLNSKKVINRFKSKLSKLSDYSKAELHRNQEAVTLQLKSYTWNFDIVPCFYTSSDFYLIPDGDGNWKKTDPRIDNDRTSNVNQQHNGKLLSLIRLMKYWNSRKVTLTIPSYLLECMILNIYDGMKTPDNWWIDIQFKNLLNHLSLVILNDVDDPKGVQGNINLFTYYERVNISNAIDLAYKKAVDARTLEQAEDQKGAIKKWREVFGEAFPEYTGD